MRQLGNKEDGLVAEVEKLRQLSESNPGKSDDYVMADALEILDYNFSIKSANGVQAASDDGNESYRCIQFSGNGFSIREKFYYRGEDSRTVSNISIVEIRKRSFLILRKLVYKGAKAYIGSSSSQFSVCFGGDKWKTGIEDMLSDVRDKKLHASDDVGEPKMTPEEERDAEAEKWAYRSQRIF